ncbi:MAG: beta-lactamase family protein [Flavobacteriales bacterium]|jgi:CubicO group peptidase (beta-lactamase class C family)|nr:beta-lactamase family protein [Flavobacteriales bacterium]MBK7481616.1 beta-lactamase family protein [Flavobacteriales bacterium]
MVRLLRIVLYDLWTTMLRHGLISICFVLALSDQAQVDPTIRNYETDAQGIVDAAVTAKKVVGIAAGFSSHGITWTHGIGFADRNADLHFTADTRTRIASIAKPMTAVAIMQLVEQGKIDLDAPVQDHITNFPVKPEGVVTVRQLLRHTAGIRAYKSNAERENTTLYPTLADALAIFQDSELVSKPGEQFNYTSYGYVILGRVIEVVSGSSYATYMQEHIWDPAGMTNTGVERTDEPGYAALYHITEKGRISERQRNSLSDRVPGGGIYSTVNDLLKFGEAVLNGTLVNAESLVEMQLDPGLKQGGNGYGLGWYLYGENSKYGPVIGHNGSQTGASTFLMLLPQQGTTVVVLSNTSGAMQEISNITVALFDPAAEMQKAP